MVVCAAGGKRHLSRFGRPPRCLILAPTRELANQVAKEFETACPNLVVKSVYGGVSIGVQISALERGVDVVVGTPGRVIDLIERRKLNLSAVSETEGCYTLIHTVSLLERMMLFHVLILPAVADTCSSAPGLITAASLLSTSRDSQLNCVEGQQCICI